MQKKALFRFYEELNDFLPDTKKKKEFPYFFSGNPSIKNAIEAIGVPHTEVDLILVNHTSKDFTYTIRNGDKISVYPVFESMDITPVTRLKNRPLRNMKFILDVHLGKLARLLRLMGFDTTYENTLHDNKIISLSAKEKRIILTRDKGILKHGDVTHGYWIRSQFPHEQLIEVCKIFDLYSKIKPFARCLVCNGTIEKIDKKKIEHLLKPKTKKFYTTFYKCKKCNKVYWEGSHYQKMAKFLHMFVTEEKT